MPKETLALAGLLFVRGTGNWNTVWFFKQIQKFFQDQAQREKGFLIILSDFIWLKQFVPLPCGLIRSRPGPWVWRGWSGLSSSPHFAFHLGAAVLLVGTHVWTSLKLQTEIQAHPAKESLGVCGNGWCCRIETMLNFCNATIVEQMRFVPFSILVLNASLQTVWAFYWRPFGWLQKAGQHLFL